MAVADGNNSKPCIRERLSDTGKAFYCICFTSRSGSGLLCDDLTQWKVGTPEEYFTFWRSEKLPPGRHVSSLTEYLIRMVNEEAGDTFGFKICWNQMYELTQRLRAEGAGEVTFDLRTIFPRLQYVRLIRRNKVEQAVSSWRADIANVWHKAVGATEDPGRPEYDFDMIRAHFLRFVVHDFLWQNHFDQLDIDPFVLYYEEYVGDREAHLTEIAHYLGATPSPTPLAERLVIMRDDWTSRMVSRFTADLQVPKAYWPYRDSGPWVDDLRSWLVDDVRSWLREGAALSERAVRGLQRRMRRAQVPAVYEVLPARKESAERT